MGNMINRKNVDYFEMFEEGMKIALEAAEILQTSFADGDIDELEVKRIKEVEHKGDMHVHECLKIIDIAFITPIDRSDIVEIIKAIENLTDSIDSVASHINILNITQANEYLLKLVDNIVLACKTLSDLMTAFKVFKKNQKQINACIVEVNRIEEEGDRTYAACMRDLFANETDAINIIRQKEMYQLLEHAIDCCEDIADLVEKVMVSKT